MSETPNTTPNTPLPHPEDVRIAGGPTLPDEDIHDAVIVEDLGAPTEQGAAVAPTEGNPQADTEIVDEPDQPDNRELLDRLSPEEQKRLYDAMGKSLVDAVSQAEQNGASPEDIAEMRQILRDNPGAFSPGQTRQLDNLLTRALRRSAEKRVAAATQPATGASQQQSGGKQKGNHKRATRVAGPPAEDGSNTATGATRDPAAPAPVSPQTAAANRAGAARRRAAQGRADTQPQQAPEQTPEAKVAEIQNLFDNLHRVRYADETDYEVHLRDVKEAKEALAAAAREITRGQAQAVGTYLAKILTTTADGGWGADPRDVAEFQRGLDEATPNARAQYHTAFHGTMRDIEPERRQQKPAPTPASTPTAEPDMRGQAPGYSDTVGSVPSGEPAPSSRPEKTPDEVVDEIFRLTREMVQIGSAGLGHEEAMRRQAPLDAELGQIIGNLTPEQARTLGARNMQLQGTVGNLVADDSRTAADEAALRDAGETMTGMRYVVDNMIDGDAIDPDIRDAFREGMGFGPASPAAPADPGATAPTSPSGDTAGSAAPKDLATMLDEYAAKHGIDFDDDSEPTGTGPSGADDEPGTRGTRASAPTPEDEPTRAIGNDDLLRLYRNAVGEDGWNAIAAGGSRLLRNGLRNPDTPEARLRANEVILGWAHERNTREGREHIPTGDARAIFEAYRTLATDVRFAGRDPRTGDVRYANTNNEPLSPVMVEALRGVANVPEIIDQLDAANGMWAALEGNQRLIVLTRGRNGEYPAVPDGVTVIDRQEFDRVIVPLWENSQAYRALPHPSHTDDEILAWARGHAGEQRELSNQLKQLIAEDEALAQAEGRPTLAERMELHEDATWQYDDWVRFRTEQARTDARDEAQTQRDGAIQSLRDQLAAATSDEARAGLERRIRVLEDGRDAYIERIVSEAEEAAQVALRTELNDPEAIADAYTVAAVNRRRYGTRPPYTGAAAPTGTAAPTRPIPPVSGAGAPPTPPAPAPTPASSRPDMSPEDETALRRSLAIRNRLGGTAMGPPPTAPPGAAY